MNSERKCINRLKELTFISLLLICNIFAKAQVEIGKSYIPPSPQASSLGMFVDASKGNYSGLAEVVVPIYDINTSSLKMHIGLSYFSGGIKEADEGSWVGLNWSLSAGGVIGRVKRDRDDFEDKGFYKIEHQYRHFDEDYDQEPDIFFYNFNGYTGKFMLLQTYNSPGYIVKEMTKSSLKITMSPNGWKVITPDGIEYLFGKEEKTDEHYSITSEGSSHSESHTFISAWYLTKVTAINGEKLELFYNSNPLKIRKTFNQNGHVLLNNVTPSYAAGCPSVGEFNMNYHSTYSSSTSITDVDEVLLQKISFNNGTIIFNTTYRVDLNTIGNEGKKLSSIVIYKGPETNLDILTTFDFTYDYYSSTSNRPDKISKRLRLRKVQESSSNLQKAPYKFDYYSTYVCDKDVKDGTMGYMNGSANSILEKITFPTGGYSYFTFEFNNVTDILNVPYSPGIRIKEIKQGDGININEVNVKKFEYTGGRILGRYISGLYYQYVTYATFNDCWVQGGPGSTISAALTWTKITNADHSSIAELAESKVIGYDKVTVFSGANGENGKTVYEYENTIPSNPTNNFIFYPVNLPQGYGSLKIITQFKFDGTNYIPVSKKEMSYNSTEGYDIIARKRAHNTCWDYPISTAWIQCTQEVTSTYDESGNNPVVKTRAFTYNNTNNLLPTKVDVTNSKGEVISTTFKYPHEAALGITGGVYNSMISKNMISPLIEQVVKNNGTQISKTSTSYIEYLNSGNNNLIVPQKITNNGAAGQVTPIRDKVTHFYQYNDDGNVIETGDDNDIRTSYIWGYKNTYPIAEAKNSTSNSIGFTGFEDANETYWRLGGFNAVNLQTDCRTGKYSYKCEQGSLAYGPSMNFLPYQKGKYVFSCWVKTPVNYSGGAYVVLNTIDNVNIPLGSFFPTNSTESNKSVQITNTTGTWKYFEVTLDLDKVHLDLGSNIPLVIRAYVYNTDQNNYFLIDDMRFYPESAKMTSYTYDPLVGITSTTSPNNKSTYYEYDKLSRLTVIRDNDRNVIKKMCYNYAGQTENCYTIYKSPYYWGYVFRDNCTPPLVGTPILFQLAEGYFTSVISQEDANAKLNAYIQQQANLQGNCITPLYGRIEYIPTTLAHYEYPDEIYTNQYVEVWVKFYSDQGCTQPFTLTQNINIQYTGTESMLYPSSFTTNTWTDSKVVLAGQNGIQLLAETSLFGEWELYDQNGQSSYFERWAGQISLDPANGFFLMAPSNYNGLMLPPWF